MLMPARVQFAFTMAFHILFPALTIGLASYLVTLEALWLLSRRAVFRSLYDFWVRLFALCFGIGVVSGIVMSYQIGTNWSGFADAVGSVLGPLFGYEVLTAFFLEASFLGIMLFGRGRVSDWVHLLATMLVALGTLLSAFWILAANSWMHTPAGFELDGGRYLPLDWRALILSPSLPYRLVHMLIAAYLTTAMIVAGVGAWLLLRRGADDPVHGPARVMLRMSMPFIALAAAAQIVAGHEHGQNVHAHQPTKLAAIEGHWDSYERAAPLVLFGLPDRDAERNHLELAVPALGSLVVTGSVDGAIRGLKSWPAEDRPPVAVVFWSFRLMVGLGLIMLAVGCVGTWLLLRRQLAERRDFLKLCVAVSPAGLVAVLAGWVTTEVGRQPWVVYGMLRTAHAVSPVDAGAVGLSLIVFVFTYGVILAAGLYFLAGVVRAGPPRAAPSLAAGREADRRAAEEPPPTRETAWAGVDVEQPGP